MVQKANPHYSNKEVLEKTWSIMYGLTLEEARQQAKEEYDRRGIEITDSFGDQRRFNRRVYEIIQQKRGEEAVKAGQLAANRYTFKATDAGVGALVSNILLGIKKGFNIPFNLAAQQFEGVSPILAERIRQAGMLLNEITFNTVLPFIKGITNILEKRLELFPPYGLAKGITYTAIAALNSDSKEYDYKRAGEYYYRAAVGGVMMILLNMMADDDEDYLGLKKIYATGTPDIRDNKIKSTVEPTTSIVIGGKKIPAQALGTLDLDMLALGVYYDIQRERARMSALEKEEATPIMLDAAARMGKGVMQDEYLRGFESLFKGITAPTENYWYRTSAELSTRLLIPMTATVRQAYDMAQEDAVKPVTFVDHLARQSGVVGGWLLDRKAYDYRGRTYDTGDVYGNSTRAFINMTSDFTKDDKIDKFVDKYAANFRTSTPNSKDRMIMSKNGEMRQMDNVEFYDFGKAKGEMVNKLLQQYITKNPEAETYEGKIPSEGTESYDKLYQEALLQLKQSGNKVDTASEEFDTKVREKMEVLAGQLEKPKAIKETLNRINNISEKFVFKQMLEKMNAFIPSDIEQVDADLEDLQIDIENIGVSKRFQKKKPKRK
jgi:hypothetical protein